MEDIKLSNESNLVECKVCKQLKVKTEAGFYPGKGRTKKYVDEFLKQWSGKTCPPCHRENAKKTMSSHRLLNGHIKKLIND